MSKQDFSPELFASGLPEEHLEVLSEFAEEAEVQLRLLSQSIKHHREPTARELLNVLAAAPKELEKKRRARRVPKNIDQEWSAELGREVTAAEKKGRRLSAILTHPEIRLMLRHTRDDLRDHLIIRVLYASGLRRSELTDLVIADFDQHKGSLFIRAGKGDKDRYTLLDPETSRLLALFIGSRSSDGRIFDISDKTVNRVVKRVAKATGINSRYEAMNRRFSAHSLRHTFATHLYEEGINLFELRDLLGHRFLGTTQKYVQTSVARIRKSYLSSHPLNKGASEEL